MSQSRESAAPALDYFVLMHQLQQSLLLSSLMQTAYLRPPMKHISEYQTSITATHKHSPCHGGPLNTLLTHPD